MEIQQAYSKTNDSMRVLATEFEIAIQRRNDAIEIREGNDGFNSAVCRSSWHSITQALEKMTRQSRSRRSSG